MRVQFRKIAIIIIVLIVAAGSLGAATVDEQLRIAASQESYHQIAELIAQGANPLSVDLDGKDAIDRALETQQSFEVLNELITAAATQGERIALAIPLSRLFSKDIELLLMNVSMEVPKGTSRLHRLLRAIYDASLQQLSVPRQISEDSLALVVEFPEGESWPPVFHISISDVVLGNHSFRFHAEGSLSYLEAGSFASLRERNLVARGLWSIQRTHDQFALVIEHIDVIDADTGEVLKHVQLHTTVAVFQGTSITDSTAFQEPVATPVPTAAGAGAYHALVIMSDQTVLAAGLNANGQLGLPKTEGTDRFEVLDNRFQTVSAGGRFTFALDTHGSLYGWGDNSFGQLGAGSHQTVPYPIKLLDDVSSVSTGWYHSMVVRSDGTLWAAGLNQNGQFGDLTASNSDRFKQIADRMKAVACGGYHTAFLDYNGTLWTTGNNNFGQLGDASVVPKIKPVKVAEQVKSIAAGGFHTLYIDSNDTLWAAGANEVGQLGTGNTVESHEFVRVADAVIAAAAGRNFTVFIDKNGDLWATGDNRFGQLGIEASPPILVPVKVMENVKSVTAGWYHVLVIDQNDNLITMGYNGNGQLGAGMPQWATGPHVIDI